MDITLWITLIFGKPCSRTVQTDGYRLREAVIDRQKTEVFLFNDALNTFYLRLYGVRHMVTDHSDSAKGNLLLSINSKGSFICTIPQPLLHQSWSTGWNEKQLNGSTPWRVDPTTHRTMSECSTSELRPAPGCDRFLTGNSNWRVINKSIRTTLFVTRMSTAHSIFHYADETDLKRINLGFSQVDFADKL